MKLFLKFCVFFTIFHHIKSDYYTSIVGLEDLIYVEKDFIKAVETYFDNVDKVNKEIESFLDEVELQRDEILNNPNKYYGDPVNAFSIIKRLVLDWKHINYLSGLTAEYQAYNSSITLPDDYFETPTNDDLQGAARGLLRLQKMYKLDTEDIAEGYLKDYQYSEDMTAEECFVMAKSLYEVGEYLYASKWLTVAMNKLDDMKNEEDAEETDNNISKRYEYPSVTYIEIFEYLAPALYNAGNRKLANLINYQLLQMDPENPYGLANKNVFLNGVMQERQVRIINNQPILQKSQVQDLYAKVCSGDLYLTATEQRPLRCRYVTNNVPFYMMGPFKMEELNHEPFVAFFHQTIYDGEIEQIIDNVEDQVERSKIGTTSSSDYNEIRISKNSWLCFKEHKFLSKIYQRLEDITGLSMSTGEPLQVANYGIGGHYGPHYDFSDEPDLDYPGKGNRILTALFYINDVELGGATAFPFLRLAVPPIKNSLVVWHNMHKSLELDYRTKHAGCPVLKGSKWICNEWFHAVGQEFQRPCSLKPDGEISKHYKDII